MYFKNIAWIALLLVSLTSVTVAEQKAEQANGINQLGFQIINKIQQSNNGNIFISPFSLHEALSMAYVGAQGETRTELGKFLGLDPQLKDSAILSNAWENLLANLTAADPNVKLEIANSMWANLDNQVKFIPEFVSLNERAHRATVREMDFQDASFLPAINGWVSEETNQKIPCILEGPIEKDQLFYLVNAIYFKGAWKNAFNEEITHKSLFTTLRGDEVPAQMMVQEGRFSYGTTDNGSKTVEIPFGSENRIVMVLYLPNQGNELRFFSSLTRDEIIRLDENRSMERGTIILPRFKIEYGNADLVELLKQLGVELAFSDFAEFPGITYEPSKINKIIHKAVIEVMEEGAEATAATVVGGIRATSVGPENHFFFHANRPFYFEIRDQESDVTLFAGILKEPKDPKAN